MEKTRSGLRERIFIVSISELKATSKAVCRIDSSSFCKYQRANFDGAYGIAGAMFGTELTTAKLRQSEQESTQLEYRQNALVLSFPLLF